MNASLFGTPTERQAGLLKTIRDFIAKHGFPPTNREIADLHGFSFAAAHQHLELLEKKGLVEIAPGIARGIRLTDRVRVDPVVPIVPGTTETLCGVLDRIERRIPDIDYPAVRLDLCLARKRIEELLGRVVREVR